MGYTLREKLHDPCACGIQIGALRSVSSVIDHGVNEGEPVDEQYREQVCEDQFRDPEPEGQYLDQDFPEGFENGKFNHIL